MGDYMVALRNGSTGAWGYDPSKDPRIEDESLKKRFAAEQLRQPGSEHHIVLTLIPDNPDVAMHALSVWRNDPVVIRERLRLEQEYGERAELPSKETVLKEILGLARKDNFTVNERLNAYKLYSEMQGYSGRTANTATSVSIQANKVMYVKDHGPDQSWESRAETQQQNLVNAARDDAQRNTTH